MSAHLIKDLNANTIASIRACVKQTRIKNNIIILCALDNLVKGASGQAIQNMNILFKFSEYLGLKWR